MKMNDTENELNIFFNSCAQQVRDNKDYIQKQILISDDDIKSIKVKQPEIDISILTKLIAQKAGYYRQKSNTERKEIYHSIYEKPFDSPLSSLWFCYYRFLFFKRLNRQEYCEIALDIVYNSFLKFMKYINLDIVNTGKQITALLALVLQSNLVNEFQSAKKIKHFYEDNKVAFDESIDQEAFAYNDYLEEVIAEIKNQREVSTKDKIIYVIEYLSECLPHEYELKQNLDDLVSGKTEQLSDYCAKIVNDFLKENNMTPSDAIERAIENHKEYKNMLVEELEIN